VLATHLFRNIAIDQGWQNFFALMPIFKNCGLQQINFLFVFLKNKKNTSVYGVFLQYHVHIQVNALLNFATGTTKTKHENLQKL
jgi:hypothetical protein